MPEEALKAAIEGRVQEIKQRLEREVRALLSCSHQRQADQCDQCKGKTERGAPMDLALEVLREAGLVEVEIAVKIPKDGKESIRHRRSLKTIIGVGIGVSFFLGFAGWQGGKLVARLIKKDTAAAGS